MIITIEHVSVNAKIVTGATGLPPAFRMHAGGKPLAPVTILALIDTCSGSADHRVCLHLDLESWHSSVVHNFLCKKHFVC